MSNPYKPNTVAVPHIIFDYWMPRLTDGEFKVLMAIARKTYGWQKVRDMISLKQIEDMTGLSRRGIMKIVDSLVERRIVIRTRSKTEAGDDAPNVYEINTDYEEQGGVNADGGGRELSSLGVGNSVPQGGRELSSPTKETTNTKETIQKSIAQTASRPRKNEHEFTFSFEERKFKNITSEDIQSWKEIYTSVDITRELKKIVQWALANPTKSKPKVRWRQCITGWLSKEHDKISNQQAWKNSQQDKVIERNSGFQKDERPRDPSKTIKVGYGNPLRKAIE